MTDFASSLTTSSSHADDSVCKETEPHHHHRHHHHLPQPQIIYVVANPQDIPINAIRQSWPPMPVPVIAPAPIAQATSMVPPPLPASPVAAHTPSTPANKVSSPPRSQPAATACTTIVDDCCVDCCPVAAQETQSPSCCSPPDQQRPLPAAYALRPAVSHHYQSLRPIAPYTMPSAPTAANPTPVATAISDYHRQHNAFTQYAGRLNTPHTQHGQRQSLVTRSLSDPTTPTLTSQDALTTHPPQKETNEASAQTQNQRSSSEELGSSDLDRLDTASLATLSEAAAAHTSSNETAGHKRKLDEQQGEARCLWAACAAVFKCIDDLIPHLTKLHVGSKSIKASNQCRWETCQTEKEDTDDLITHLCEEHLGASELKHGCHWQGCETRFESFDDLTGHLSERHIGTGKSQYVCSWEECERQGRAFTQRQKVMRHIQTHTGKRWTENDKSFFLFQGFPLIQTDFFPSTQCLRRQTLSMQHL